MQYNDNVIGPGSPHYDNAYFTINYVRVYTVNGLPASTSNLLHQSSTTGTSKPTATGDKSKPNAGAVFEISSSLQLFLLCVAGAIAVFI